MPETSIVLVEPSHPGNIGAVARAMKNMGLSDLRLVSPKRFPSVEATVRASGADDILANARIETSLEGAIADANLVFGTSARSRTLPWPILTPREAVAQCDSRAYDRRAFVFGRENSGLTNEELSMCQFHINIPTVANFSSLNLGAAVQVLVYELFASAQEMSPVGVDAVDLATMADMQGMLEHIKAVMIETQFLNPNQPKKLLSRVQRLFHRAEITKTEVNIIRGFLAAVEKKMK